MLNISSRSVPDQNGPLTPGMNNLLLDMAIWQVEVPQTNTMWWHMTSISHSENIIVIRNILHKVKLLNHANKKFF